MKNNKGFTRTNFNNNKQNLRGFTLIELLVAISIVAVLATIGFTLFQGAQASARDGKRRADVNAMATALETHFNATDGIYTPLVAASPTYANLWFSDKIIPVDPLNSNGYSYSYPTVAATTYTVSAKLEKGGGNFTTAACDVSATGATALYYCKINQQQ